MSTTGVECQIDTTGSTLGDNNLESLRRAEQTWKMRMIEEELKRRMLDLKDI